MITITFEVNTPEEAIEILSRAQTGNAVAVVELPDAKTVAPVPPVTQPGTEGIDAANTPVASAAVLQLLAANNLDGSEVTGTGKEGRLTKADVVAYLKANTPPAAPEADPFALDDGAPVEPAPATKEQVREALVSYQTAVKNSLIAAGKTEVEAGPEAMETARGLLGKISGGAGTLGALSEAQYGAVVLAAQAAQNALTA